MYPELILLGLVCLMWGATVVWTSFIEKKQ